MTWRYSRRLFDAPALLSPRATDLLENNLSSVLVMPSDVFANKSTRDRRCPYYFRFVRL